MGGAQSSPIAFEAVLRAVAPEPASAAANTAAAPQQPPPAEASQPQTQVRPVAAAEPVTAPAAASGKHDENQHGQPERQAKAPVAPAALAPSAAQSELPSGAAANFVAAPVAPAPAVHSAAAARQVVEVPAPAAPAPDPAPVPAAATDIKIALIDNGQRVELRVTDRGGDIHLTVRSPDAQLAASLRDDLPALSSKLEQSGFHSDMCAPPHPPAAWKRRSRPPPGARRTIPASRAADANSGKTRNRIPGIRSSNKIANPIERNSHGFFNPFVRPNAAYAARAHDACYQVHYRGAVKPPRQPQPQPHPRPVLPPCSHK